MVAMLAIGLPDRLNEGKGLLSMLFWMLFWPFEYLFEDRRIDSFLSLPYMFFGAVGFAYYLLLNLFRQFSAKRLIVHLLMGSLSGCLGSLWVWVTLQRWYFSPLHGTIWGSLVGFGVWRAVREGHRT